MKHLQMFVFMVFAFFIKNDLQAQCNPDVTPPNAICKNGLVATLGPNGAVTLWGSDFDDGSYDACSNIDFFIEEGLPPSPNPPTTQSIVFDTTDIGFHDIVLWVVDQAGNHNTCIVTLEIKACQGTPNLSCNTMVFISLSINGTGAIEPDMILEGGPYCYFNMGVDFEPGGGFPGLPSLPIDTSDIGSHTVVVYDSQSGNSCWGTVEIQAYGGSNCNPDVTPPIAVCDAYTTMLLGANGTGAISAEVFDDGSYDLCAGSIDFFVEEGLPPSANPPSTVSLTFDLSDIGLHDIVMWVVDQVGNHNYCTVVLEVKNNLAQCNPDIAPPVAVCKQSLSAGLDNNGQLTIWGTDYDDGSYDLCSAVSFFIEENTAPSPTPPTTQSLDFDTSDIGLHNIVLWVSDTAGNWNTCVSTLDIKDCIGIPSLTCNDSVTVVVWPGNTTQFYPEDILEGGPYCYFDMSIALDPPSVFGPYLEFDTADVGTYIVQVQNGANGNSCWGNLIVGIPFQCNPDITPPVAVCDQSVTVVLARDMANFNTVTVDATFLDDGSYDNCTSNIDFRIEKGVAPSANAPTSTTITFDETELGQQDAVLWAGDGSGNWNQCFVEILVIVKCALLAPYSAVEGTVFIDAIANCQLDSTENHLAGWPVKVTGLISGDIINVLTDSSGYYFAGVCAEDSLVEVSLQVPFNYGQTCQTTHTVDIAQGGNFIETQNVPVALETGCPLMQVDIATPFVRRCFDSYYIVSYCNYHSETIEDVQVEVALDSFMTFTNSSIPGTPLGGNVYSFGIGNLGAGECGDFRVDFNTSCNADLGYTHCSEARIFPDTLCGNGGMAWSGADIRVLGYCDNDTVRLSIKNVGQSAMVQPQEYIVVEDVIMYLNGTFDLGAGAAQLLAPIMANGATWRLEADQEPGHPYGGVQSVAVEGCQGLNVPGLVNLFPISSPNPFIATDCQENIGSFDPNDKQAFPTGYGPEHFIERNTDIEYLIRFQNTGTDTAFTVVIVDELDPAFDPMTIRPGASSHPYQFELVDGNKMRFTFNDIMLPDSNANEAASHGFVKFKASQLVGLPLGTVIENSAAIYFDFNDPVITNALFHTIGANFIEIISDTNERPASLGDLLTYPNPSFGDVTFKIPTTAPVEAVFTLHDALGKQLVVEPFTATNMYRFERGGLAPGVYFYNVEIDGLGRYAGKVVLK